ncbi:MAG: hypothetical protein ABSC57_09965 [Syntrophales bacterium]
MQADDAHSLCAHEIKARSSCAGSLMSLPRGFPGQVRETVRQIGTERVTVPGGGILLPDRGAWITTSLSPTIACEGCRRETPLCGKERGEKGHRHLQIPT